MSKPANQRYTIAVDFDGVIHRYDSPWINAHTIPDPPVEGAMSWLFNMIETFDIVIFSTRCKTWRGRLAVHRWLREHSGNFYHESCGHPGVEDVRLSFKKPPALIYLDDRAIRFQGVFPTKSEIHMARPWNKSK